MLEELITENLLIQNVYFEKYLNLIKDRGNSTAKTRQKHHIVPTSYFRYKNIPVDKSPGYIVMLDYRDYILAHYYLSLCSSS